MNIEDKRIVATLKKAKGILQKNGWCRNYDAQDKKGNHVGPTSKHAVSFCALGAIKRACKVTILGALGLDCSPYANTRGAMEDTLMGTGPLGVADYNDRHAKGKRDIIRLFDRTIKRLSK